MKNVDQLIEYIQRELNTKRFLNESLDFLTGLRDAEAEVKENEAAIAKSAKAKDKAAAELETITTALADAKAQLATLTEQGTQTTEAATLKASQIIADAKAAAAKLLENASAKAIKYDEAVAASQQTQRDIIAKNAELAEQTDKLQSGLNALKKKLG